MFWEVSCPCVPWGLVLGQVICRPSPGLISTRRKASFPQTFVLFLDSIKMFEEYKVFHLFFSCIFLQSGLLKCIYSILGPLSFSLSLKAEPDKLPGGNFILHISVSPIPSSEPGPWQVSSEYLPNELMSENEVWPSFQPQIPQIRHPCLHWYYETLNTD